MDVGRVSVVSDQQAICVRGVGPEPQGGGAEPGRKMSEMQKPGNGQAAGNAE